MKREELIEQVREEYANIANNPNQQHFFQTTDETTPRMYYRHLRDAVIAEINKGTFDTCHSGMEIINKVEVDKSLLTEWEG